MFNMLLNKVKLKINPTQNGIIWIFYINKILQEIEILF